jgi:hypothetical protein
VIALDGGEPEYRAKLRQFERRLEIMTRQRLNPDLPVWPAMCFYRMRFDEASARYAEFGPFYAGYLASAREILDHCRIGGRESVAEGLPANGLTALTGA